MMPPNAVDIYTSDEKFTPQAKEFAPQQKMQAGSVSDCFLNDNEKIAQNSWLYMRLARSWIANQVKPPMLKLQQAPRQNHYCICIHYQQERHTFKRKN
jgi:hypothetical protein